MQLRYLWSKLSQLLKLDQLSDSGWIPVSRTCSISLKQRMAKFSKRFHYIIHLKVHSRVKELSFALSPELGFQKKRFRPEKSKEQLKLTGHGSHIRPGFTFFDPSTVNTRFREVLATERREEMGGHLPLPVITFASLGEQGNVTSSSKGGFGESFPTREQLLRDYFRFGRHGRKSLSPWSWYGWIQPRSLLPALLHQLKAHALDKDRRVSVSQITLEFMKQKRRTFPNIRNLILQQQRLLRRHGVSSCRISRNIFAAVPSRILHMCVSVKFLLL